MCTELQGNRMLANMWEYSNLDLLISQFPNQSLYPQITGILNVPICMDPAMTPNYS